MSYTHMGMLAGVSNLWFDFVVCVQGFSYSRTQMQGFTARIQAQTVEKNSAGICCVSLLWLAGSIR